MSATHRRRRRSRPNAGFSRKVSPLALNMRKWSGFSPAPVNDGTKPHVMDSTRRSSGGSPLVGSDARTHGRAAPGCALYLGTYASRWTHSEVPEAAATRSALSVARARPHIHAADARAQVEWR
jgi:hypothetical protein